MNRINLTLNISHQCTLNVDECITAANKGAGHGDERWRHLWREPLQREQIQEINQLVQSLQPCINVLVIGIGGSALGTRALHSALTTDNPPSLFVLDNVDPVTFRKTIEQVKNEDPTQSQTVVLIVSKSGETAEIAALSMATEKAIPDATFVAITGKKGALHTLAKEKKWSTLSISEGVGGRFSVMSAVGLLPAALCGIDIEELLQGASDMDDRCSQIENNPAADLASGLVAATLGGQNIHVMMPYCDRLLQCAHWYVQLWSESLGKIDTHGNRVGPTPVAAIGATDQHSMLQLWREGPKNKVIGFLRVEEMADVALEENTFGDSSSWLCGQSLGTLLNSEQSATAEAVREAGQSTWTMSFPSVTPYYVGQFFALWQITVAIAGRLMDLNPYDQPGVEYGKHLTRDSFQ
jgi:glucose-6-phosphate isomerase